MRKALRVRMIDIVFQRTAQIVSGLGGITLLWFGGHEVTNGRLTLGELMANTFLIAGVCTTPTILEIECIGKVTDYSKQGFHAIGSGALPAQIAHGIFGHINTSDMPLDLAIAHSYRLISSVIDHYDKGIGYPVRITKITPGNGVEHLSDEELEAVKEVVRLWEQSEQEAIPGLYEAPDESPDDAPEEPTDEAEN